MENTNLEILNTLKGFLEGDEGEARTVAIASKIALPWKLVGHRWKRTGIAGRVIASIPATSTGDYRECEASDKSLTEQGFHLL